MTNRKKIELVVPVFNEQDNLSEFCKEAGRVLESELPRYDWSVIFVDDGSKDTSWEKLQGITATHPNMRALRLNHNYGSHVAISAGLNYSKGDAVVILAADLQDPPSVIPQFVREWESGKKVVWGVRSARIEAFHRKLYSRLFHRLVRKYALPTYPTQGTGSFCLIDAQVVRNLRAMREDFRTIFGLISVQRYPAAEVPYVRHDRAHGVSGWTFRKMLRTSVDVFTSYSHLPVRMVTWTGILSLCLAAFGITFQLVHYFVNRSSLPGWTLLFTAVCFFGGIQTFSIGLMGEYIWRTFHEVKKRPLWFIEEATFDYE